MKQPPYTKKRGNVWWYRRPVNPVELRPIVGRTEFAWSLGTSDMEEARPMAAIRNAEVEVLLKAAKAELARQKVSTGPFTPQTITPDLLQYTRDAVRAHLLSEDEQVRRERPDLDSLDEYESIRADQFEEAGSALRTGRTGRLRIDDALQAIGIAVPQRHHGRDDMAYAVAEGVNSALQGIKERVNGGYVSTPDRIKDYQRTHAARTGQRLTIVQTITAIVREHQANEEHAAQQHHDSKQPPAILRSL